MKNLNGIAYGINRRVIGLIIMVDTDAARFADAYRYFLSASSLRTLTSPRSIRTDP